MTQNLEIKYLDSEDIKYLNQKLIVSYFVTLFLALTSIIFCFVIYSMLKTHRIFEIVIMTFVFFIIIILTVWKIKSNLDEKRKLYSQKKIIGSLEILGKNIVVDRAETYAKYSYEIEVNSKIDNFKTSIEIRKKYFDIIEVGNLIWIEYYSDSYYIIKLKFEEQEIRSNICS